MKQPVTPDRPAGPAAWGPGDDPGDALILPTIAPEGSSTKERYRLGRCADDDVVDSRLPCITFNLT